MRSLQLFLALTLLSVIVKTGGYRDRRKQYWKKYPEKRNKYDKSGWDKGKKYDDRRKYKEEKGYYEERKPEERRSYQKSKRVFEKRPDHSSSCEEKPVYDSNILVLIWPIEYCEETKDCNNAWQTEWDGLTPVLRGFWPSGSDEYYYSCFVGEGSPSDHTCNYKAYQPQFDIDTFFSNDTDLVNEINELWSPFHKGTDRQFYKQEWVKHGMCYLMNMIEDNPKAYQADPAAFNYTILSEYFKNGISKMKKFKLQLNPQETYMTKTEFAKLIGFEGKEDHFNLICGKDNQVDEIHICFNRTKTPGKETTIACPPYDTCHSYSTFKIR